MYKSCDLRATVHHVSNKKQTRCRYKLMRSQQNLQTKPYKLKFKSHVEYVYIYKRKN